MHRHPGCWAHVRGDGRRVSRVQRLLITALVTLVGFVSVPASAQTLAGGWTNADIGEPVVEGGASSTGSTITLEGCGEVWGAADQAHYVYRRVRGDVTIVARVTSVEHIADWTKAGVMIRASLSADSKQAFMLVSPARGMAFQRRRATAGTPVHTSGGPYAAPMWVRLERRGTTITASRSADGSTWTTVGTDTISMAPNVYVGLAVASRDEATLATATFTDVAVTTPLPAGWSKADIATPVAGTAIFANDRFTIAGTGSDIWSTADEFTYVYRSLAGDGSIVVHVSSLEDPSPWTKAGLMIRASTSSEAPHASVFITPEEGVAFQRRHIDGGESSHTDGLAGVAPIWLKLERRGSMITAFRSDDAALWTDVGSDVVELDADVLVGMAVSSHSSDEPAMATFSDVSVESVDPIQPPTVALTAPADKAAFTAPATITVSATASDPDGTVVRVDFYAGATSIGSDTTSPYSVTWTDVAAGTYSLTAVARDNDGATASSPARTIIVSEDPREDPDTEPPTVSISSPGLGDIVNGVVLLAATASDNVGVISVTFKVDGGTTGTDVSAPYSLTWDSARVTVGAHVISAEAVDAAGNVGGSAAVPILVLPPDPEPLPTKVAFTPSSDHESAVDYYELDIFLAGADPTPIRSQNLGKPEVVNDECIVDIAATILALPPGGYFATVTAVGPEGSTSSEASPPFTR